jgi:hypothetical protein
MQPRRAAGLCHALASARTGSTDSERRWCPPWRRTRRRDGSVPAGRERRIRAHPHPRLAAKTFRSSIPSIRAVLLDRRVARAPRAQRRRLRPVASSCRDQRSAAERRRSNAVSVDVAVPAPPGRPRSWRSPSPTTVPQRELGRRRDARHTSATLVQRPPRRAAPREIAPRSPSAVTAKYVRRNRGCLPVRERPGTRIRSSTGIAQDVRGTARPFSRRRTCRSRRRRQQFAPGADLCEQRAGSSTRSR